MANNQEESTLKISKVKPLEGITDYRHWRRNARAFITCSDPLLLVLKLSLTGESPKEYTVFKKANSRAKICIIIMLSEQVQVCAIAYCDGDSKTAYEL